MPHGLKQKLCHTMFSGCTMWRGKKEKIKRERRGNQNQLLKTLTPKHKKVFKLQGAQYIVQHKSWILDCHLDVHLGRKKSSVSEELYSDCRFILSLSIKHAVTDIYTHLFQHLVRVPLPHILVFVICIRIALPENKTNNTNMSLVK